MVDYNKIIKNEGNLIEFLYSYNWDDGFKIPYKMNGILKRCLIH